MIEMTVLPESSNGHEPPSSPEALASPEADAAAETDATADVAATAEEAEVEPAPQAMRRASRFMAELSRAMKAAVETARTETMARFEVEAKSVVDDVHAGATTEGADLRRKADDDVAAIRDWSKTEIARVREETESRIAARKAALDSEMEEHAATIEARTQRVALVVAAYEAELGGFFERLNAEEDPTRIATMAESMPEPPSLADVAASVVNPSEPSAERFARVFASSQEGAESTPVDFAAAEMEAAAFNADQVGEEDLTPPSAEQLADVSVEETPPAVEEGAAAEPGTTRVVVSGLVSVANIANFKRSLGRLPGVSRIAVASGRDGDFAFTVGHSLGSALMESVRSLPGFDIEVSAEHDGVIIVTAHDREAGN